MFKNTVSKKSKPEKIGYANLDTILHTHTENKCLVSEDSNQLYIAARSEQLSNFSAKWDRHKNSLGFHIRPIPAVQVI